MIKLWLKYKIFDVCINNMFNEMILQFSVIKCEYKIGQTFQYLIAEGLNAFDENMTMRLYHCKIIDILNMHMRGKDCITAKIQYGEITVSNSSVLSTNTNIVHIPLDYIKFTR